MMLVMTAEDKLRRALSNARNSNDSARRRDVDEQPRDEKGQFAGSGSTPETQSKIREAHQAYRAAVTDHYAYANAGGLSPRNFEGDPTSGFHTSYARASEALNARPMSKEDRVREYVQVHDEEKAAHEKFTAHGVPILPGGENPIHQLAAFREEHGLPDTRMLQSHPDVQETRARHEFQASREPGGENLSKITKNSITGLKERAKETFEQHWARHEENQRAQAAVPQSARDQAIAASGEAEKLSKSAKQSGHVDRFRAHTEAAQAHSIAADAHEAVGNKREARKERKLSSHHEAVAKMISDLRTELKLQHGDAMDDTAEARELARTIEREKTAKIRNAIARERGDDGEEGGEVEEVGESAGDENAEESDEPSSEHVPARSVFFQGNRSGGNRPMDKAARKALKKAKKKLQKAMADEESRGDAEQPRKENGEFGEGESGSDPGKAQRDHVQKQFEKRGHSDVKVTQSEDGEEIHVSTDKGNFTHASGSDDNHLHFTHDEGTHKPVNMALQPPTKSEKADKKSEKADKKSEKAEDKKTPEAHEKAAESHENAKAAHEEAAKEAHGEGDHAKGKEHEGKAKEHGEKAEKEHASAKEILKATAGLVGGEAAEKLAANLPGGEGGGAGKHGGGEHGGKHGGGGGGDENEDSLDSPKRRADAEWGMHLIRGDADEQARDERGQFAAGAGGASARESAKNALAHANTLKALAKQTGRPEHAAAAAQADKNVKQARGRARLAERSKDAATSNEHAAAATALEHQNRQLASTHGAPGRGLGEAAPKPVAAAAKATSEKQTIAAAATERARQATQLTAVTNGYHGNAAQSHLEAAAASTSAGDHKQASVHTQMAAAHERQSNAPEVAPTGRSVHEQMTRERMAKEAAAKTEKPEHEKVFRSSVDDYEHSGDTEHHASELRDHGARNTTEHNGEDEDGERGGHVTYQLPKGLSQPQFQAVRSAQFAAGGGMSGGGTRSSDHPLAREANQHYERAKEAARAGRGEKAAEHAAKAEAAGKAAQAAIHSGPADDASGEAHSQTERANVVNTAAAHNTAALAHQAAARTQDRAGNDEASREHSHIASRHSDAAQRASTPAGNKQTVMSKTHEAGMAYHYSEPSKF